MRRHHSRIHLPGLHFITTVTRVRGNWFVTEPVCCELLELLEGYREKFNLDCVGYVLMPDHLHALLYQDGDGSQVSQLMEGFKSVSSRRIHPPGFPEHRLWVDHFDDVPIPHEQAAEIRLDYMHQNPVKRGIVDSELNYRWSSISDYLELGKGIVKITRL